MDEMDKVDEMDKIQNKNGMRFTLKIWRQPGPNMPGKMVDYAIDGILGDMSFLEMLDTLNEQLIKKGQEPVEFDNDCREGICGMCGLVINGQPHGPVRGHTTCELYMRHFKDGATIIIEPWRAAAFPVIRDLVVDRTALDRIMQAGGYVSVRTGQAPDARSIPVPKHCADEAMDAAACVGCGACAATCKNGSAMLFVAAKASHLGLLPQGKVEQERRVLSMVKAMDAEGFGSCTVTGSCEAVCPKEIRLDFIARLNRDYLKALVTQEA
jgi:succinate dehydrogenase / fumarate reductase iron-sulfur subunit